MSRNLPYVRVVADVVEEIESLQDEITEGGRPFIEWRPYSGKWALPGPSWATGCDAFREGRDEAERKPEKAVCPVFLAATLD